MIKTILYFLVGIILLFNTPDYLLAQEVENPRETFAEKEWYLTKIVMEGEEYPFLPTGPVPISSLETQELYESNNGNIFCGIFVSHCEMCGDDVLFLSSTEFKTFGGMQYWTCMAYNNCMTSTNPELLAFAGLYEYEFWGGDNASGAYYEINIVEEEEELTLIITKEDGNHAYYSDVPLSVSIYEQEAVKLYPSPMNNQLYVENLSEITELAIYDVSGRMVLKQEVNSSSESVDVSKFSSGIYFYSLNREGLKVKAGKLVKN